MSRLIIGTAGHVDHGKTTLIKALTGIECDTHKQEKARGITINLGFAHLDLQPTVSIGIVDVPGHRDFVHTMVSGASGIDAALLVVAADSGVMPQTREHLQIMEVLGIRRGLLAITKVDLVEPELVELVEEEVERLVQDTFLRAAPVVRISARSGQGVGDLKQRLADLAGTNEPRTTDGVFRLFPDRLFLKSGFGTIVTGSVLAGVAQVGETLHVLPAGTRTRVRRLERHGVEVTRVVAGDRASLNLVGLERRSLHRGMVISGCPLQSTQMIDAKLTVFPHVPCFGPRADVIFHLGTYQQQAKLRLMEPERLIRGGSALVQIYLPTACVVQHGDRFVVRTTSSDVTLGGGEVIDPFPLHHRRRTAKAIDGMQRIAQGRVPELVACEARKRPQGVGHREIARVLGLGEQQVLAVLARGLPDDVVTCVAEGQTYVLTRQRVDELGKGVLHLLEAHHERNRLREDGLTPEEMMGPLGLGGEQQAEPLFRHLLTRLEAQNAIRREGHTFVLSHHRVLLTNEIQAQIAAVEDLVRRSGMAALTLLQVGEGVEHRGVSTALLNQIAHHLVQRRQICVSEGRLLHAAIVDACRRKLLEALAAAPQGISLAGFRDLTGGNRRACLLLFRIYQTEGVLKRVGDVRVLTAKGKALLDA